MFFKAFWRLGGLVAICVAIGVHFAQKLPFALTSDEMVLIALGTGVLLPLVIALVWLLTIYALDQLAELGVIMVEWLWLVFDRRNLKRTVDRAQGRRHRRAHAMVKQYLGCIYWFVGKKV